VKKSRILILEDERITAEDIKKTLENFGYEVCGIISNGEEALLKIPELNPDLVLMDIFLEGNSDGIKIAGEIKSRFNIPLIYLTAYADEEILMRAKSTEPFGYILKPFEDRELYSNIEMAIYKSTTEKKIEHINLILKAIRDVNQLLVSEKNKNILIKTVCDILVSGKGYFTAWIAIVNTKGEIENVYQSGMSEKFDTFRKRLKEGYKSLCMTEVSEREGMFPFEPEVKNSCADCEFLDVKGDAGTYAAILKYNEKIYGYICVSLPKNASIIEEERTLFAELSKDLSIALNNIELGESHKNVEKALIQSEERFRNLVENQGEGIGIVDSDENFIFANPAVNELFGFKTGTLIGRNISEFVNNETLDLILKETEFRRAGEKNFYEIDIKRIDGEKRTLLVSASPHLSNEGIFLGSFVIFRDITLQKKAEAEIIIAKEKAEEMSRIKSNFLANMSHELRTPMVAILGFSEILLTYHKDPEIAEMIKSIHLGGKRLMHTINSILDLSRLESSNTQLSKTVTDILLIIEDEVKLYKSIAANKNIYINIESDKKEFRIATDEKIVQSIIENLLNNAIKFTNNGGITINVKREYYRKNICEWVVISISDTGIGIPKESLHIIFDEFRQVSEGLGRRFEGTGLGLTITKKLVELIGGEISVESKPGKGSTFTVKIPVEISSEIKKT
jgi:PAS domain S-box-containing protein